MTENELRELETLLTDAAAKAESAVALLDLRQTTCSDCQRPLFVDIAHAKVYERIGPVAGKLRVAAARLRHAHEFGVEDPGCTCQRVHDHRVYDNTANALGVRCRKGHTHNSISDVRACEAPLTEREA